MQWGGESTHTSWGGDTRDLEIGQSNDDALEEEELAKNIVRQQLSQLDDDAFALDGENTVTGDSTVVMGTATTLMLGGKARSEGNVYGAMTSLLRPRATSPVTIKDKTKLPSELYALRRRLGEAVQDLNCNVWPALEALCGNDKRDRINAAAVYLLLKEQLLLSFISNVSFYIFFLSEVKIISKHPALPRITSVKRKIDALKSLKLAFAKEQKQENECRDRRIHLIRPPKDHQAECIFDKNEEVTQTIEALPDFEKSDCSLMGSNHLKAAVTFAKTFREQKHETPKTSGCGDDGVNFSSFLFNDRRNIKKNGNNEIEIGGHSTESNQYYLTNKDGSLEHGEANFLRMYEEAVKSQNDLRANKKAKYAVAPCFGSWQDNSAAGPHIFKRDRRAASKVIINNVGLKAHTPHKNRNPRIKKKTKYARAVIRRKGQVRDSLGANTIESSGYTGEASGIRGGISRSRHMSHDGPHRPTSSDLS
jgi:hypothetical protein